jgi:hypothetical protein
MSTDAVNDSDATDSTLRVTAYRTVSAELVHTGESKLRAAAQPRVGDQRRKAATPPTVTPLPPGMPPELRE